MLYLLYYTILFLACWGIYRVYLIFPEKTKQVSKSQYRHGFLTLNLKLEAAMSKMPSYYYLPHMTLKELRTIISFQFSRQYVNDISYQDHTFRTTPRKHRIQQQMPILLQNLQIRDQLCSSSHQECTSQVKTV